MLHAGTTVGYDGWCEMRDMKSVAGCERQKEVEERSDKINVFLLLLIGSGDFVLVIFKHSQWRVGVLC